MFVAGIYIDAWDNCVYIECFVLRSTIYQQKDEDGTRRRISWNLWPRHRVLLWQQFKRLNHSIIFFYFPSINFYSQPIPRLESSSFRWWTILFCDVTISCILYFIEVWLFLSPPYPTTPLSIHPSSVPRPVIKLHSSMYERFMDSKVILNWNWNPI